MSSTPVLIRSSLEADVVSITAIYAHAVQHATGTFELDTPDLAEMTCRRAAVLEKSCPWLVAEAAGRVLGFAYAQPFRPRKAYRFTLEDSIYLHHEARGMGLGRLLLAELLARCQALGARQMLAVIGDSANVASVALHRSQGFVHVGTFKDVGHKLGQWRDVVLMQCALGPGSLTPPGDQPAAAA
jgi:L-amino acid N-acyltransferase YncA